jgi:hypothetical protein
MHHYHFHAAHCRTTFDFTSTDASVQIEKVEDTSYLNQGCYTHSAGKPSDMRGFASSTRS